MKRSTTYYYIDSYLREVQSQGRYTVTLLELKTKFKTSERAILQSIYRLKCKRRLAQVRKEFYVIIPPQYLHNGMVPPTLFIDDMMNFLAREYYVGLLSAAALHGAGHQQPMEFQVITKKPPLRKISNQKLTMIFFIKNKWEKNHLTEKKTETGYIHVSSPELTAVDLVHYNKRIGGLDRILPILSELAESMKISEFGKVIKTQNGPTLQRLGYLLQELGREYLTDPIYKTIKNPTIRKNLKIVPLSLAHKNRTGTVNEKWRVIVNTKLDF